jgi:hypothetical protein
MRELFMLKWVIGIIIVLVLLLIIVQPEWLKVFFAVFSDFIQANE